MTWTEYKMMTPGASTLGIILRLRHDTPSEDTNSTKVYYEASVYKVSGGWYNLLNETAMSLSINGSSILNTATANYDLRSTTERVVKSGHVVISHNTDGTKSFPFLWEVDYRNTWATITGKTVLSGTYVLPAIPRGSKPVLSKSVFEFGESVVLTTNRSTTNLTHDVWYTHPTGDTLIARDVTDSTTVVIPQALAERFPDAEEVTLSVKVDVKRGGRLIDTKYLPFTAKLPASVVPTLTGVRLMETNRNAQVMLNSVTDYLREISAIRATALGVKGVLGSSIKQYLYRVKQRPDIRLSSAQDGQVFQPFQFPSHGKETINIQMAVVDSRGRQSAWVDSIDVNVHYYRSPILGTITPLRNDTSVTVTRNWAVSSVTLGADSSMERNTADFQIFVRQKGQSEWQKNDGAGSTALKGADASALLSGQFAGDVLYEIKAVLSDKLTTIESKPITIPLQQFPQTWHPSGKTAINKIVDENGAHLQVGGDADIAGVYKRNGAEIQMFPLSSNIGRAIYKDKTTTVNELTTTGFYQVSNATHCPSGSGNWKYVLVISYDPNWLYQQLVDMDGKGRWYRMKVGGVWKPWIQE